MVSGYTLTTFPNAFIPQQPQLSNNQQTSTVHVQMRNRDCTLIGGESGQTRNRDRTLIGGEDPDNRFYPAIKGKGKTEEQKERGTSQLSIHQKKNKLELCIISLILYLKGNREQIS